MNTVTVTSHVNFARGETKHASSARPCLLLCPGFARQKCDALPVESPVQQISIAFALRRVYDCVLLGERNNSILISNRINICFAHNTPFPHNTHRENVIPYACITCLCFSFPVHPCLAARQPDSQPAVSYIIQPVSQPASQPASQTNRLIFPARQLLSQLTCFSACHLVSGEDYRDYRCAYLGQSLENNRKSFTDLQAVFGNFWTIVGRLRKCSEIETALQLQLS